MRALTPSGGPPSEPADAGFCDQCGEPVTEGAHGRCADRRRYEPPRFCSECARRMVVQVTPVGWTARCSRHGDRHS